MEIFFGKYHSIANNLQSKTINSSTNFKCWTQSPKSPPLGISPQSSIYFRFPSSTRSINYKGSKYKAQTLYFIHNYQVTRKILLRALSPTFQLLDRSNKHCIPARTWRARIGVVHNVLLLLSPPCRVARVVRVVTSYLVTLLEVPLDVQMQNAWKFHGNVWKFYIPHSIIVQRCRRHDGRGEGRGDSSQVDAINIRSLFCASFCWDMGVFLIFWI